MNQQELGKVVARIQAGDNRTVDQVTLAHWGETIGHLPFEDALEAVVMHFRESSEYLVAAHVIRNAARIREARNPSNDTSGIDWSRKSGAPQPDNMDALTAAWDDPEAWAVEIAKYDAQLNAAGFAPVGVQVHGWYQPSRVESMRRAAA